ncbi:hypothetical protein GCM10009673_26850 [Nesterenkonia sandarakina]
MGSIQRSRLSDGLAGTSLTLPSDLLTEVDTAVAVFCIAMSLYIATARIETRNCRTLADGWGYARWYTSEKQRRDTPAEWFHE